MQAVTMATVGKNRILLFDHGDSWRLFECDPEGRFADPEPLIVPRDRRKLFQAIKDRYGSEVIWTNVGMSWGLRR